MARYKVNVGLNYGPSNKRAEPGDVVDDLPGESIRHLLDRGHIEPDRSTLSKRQLMTEAEDAGIDVPSGATKDDIVALLADVDEPEAEPAEEPEAEPEPTETEGEEA